MGVTLWHVENPAGRAVLYGLFAAGVCPGPAITAALWNPSVLAFTAALFAGVAIYEFGLERFKRNAGVVDRNQAVWDKRMMTGTSD